MRRLWLWFLPLILAVTCTFLFGYGFYLGATGRGGVPVQEPAAVTPKIKPLSGAQVLILGDSLARGAGDTSGLGVGGNLEAELKRRNVNPLRVTNIGVDGARTSDLARQLESRNVQQLIAESNVVVVSIGGNDFFGASAGERRMVTPAEGDAVMDRVEGEIASIIATIRKANPRTRIFFIGLYNPFVTTPVGASTTEAVNVWNARLLRAFRSDPNFTLVQTSDLFSHRDRLSNDRFHPGDEGYRLIARRISEAL
jgi:lysophospholipase L1-like esterase